MHDHVDIASDLVRRLTIAAPANGSPQRGDSSGNCRTVTRVQRILPAARARLATVQSQSHVVDAAKLLARGTANLVVVCDDDGHVRGIVSKTDIVRHIGQCRGCACELPVETVMIPKAFCCQPTDLLEPVWAAMKAHGFREAPVLDNDGRPLGIISARDALAALLEEMTYEEELLRGYIMSSGYR